MVDLHAKNTHVKFYTSSYMYMQLKLRTAACIYSMEISSLKVSATLKIAIFPYLRFQRFQIDMLESFLLKKNQKKILFLSKDIGGKRFFLVNYLNWSLTRSVIPVLVYQLTCLWTSNVIPSVCFDTTRANCLRVVYSL